MSKSNRKRLRRFTNARITNGRNVWNVTGTWDRITQRVEFTQVCGDINDRTGMRIAFHERHGY